MDVAGAQGASLQISELVEQEQGMVAGAAEVPVVRSALLEHFRFNLVHSHLLRRS